jgi:hypothetical protein
LPFTATAGGANPATQTLSVSNSAGNGTTLAWTASSNQTWLTASPTSGGNGPTTVTVSVNTTGLSANTYTGTLSFTGNAPNSPQTVTVTLTVTGGTGGGTPPADPNLASINERTYTTRDEIVIPPVNWATGFNWDISAVALTPASRPSPFSGEGERSAGEGAFAPIPTNAPRFNLASLTLIPGRYTLRVQATNPSGASAWMSAGITLVSSDLAAVKVYPNPWKSGKNTGDITFANLPANATVKIFTVSGHLVRELSGSGTVAWNLKTESGDRAASGVYLYLIEANGGKTKGKVAVIR